ncbi:hypothetical protein EE612_053374 [Oryza sativa]|nr:hypothetical protein EE612_053374 [Oryza sativa]
MAMDLDEPLDAEKGEAALRRLRDADPALYLSPSADLAAAAREASKHLYASLVPFSPRSRPRSPTSSQAPPSTPSRFGPRLSCSPAPSSPTCAASSAASRSNPRLSRRLVRNRSPLMPKRSQRRRTREDGEGDEEVEELDDVDDEEESEEEEEEEEEDKEGLEDKSRESSGGRVLQDKGSR